MIQYVVATYAQEAKFTHSERVNAGCPCAPFIQPIIYPYASASNFCSRDVARQRRQVSASKPTMFRRNAAGAAWPALLFWTFAIWHLHSVVAVNSADTVTGSMAWMDSSYSTEYRAASVVTSLWLGAFAVTSALIGILGAIVALQWPNPRVLCYKTSYSDMPSSSARSCCSLYSLNLGFCVFWLLVFAIMVVARDVVRIVVCLCFFLAHTAVVAVFKMKFKRFGRPERPYGPDMVSSSTSAAPGGGFHDPHAQAVGIPIYNIPMQTVVVGAPADSNAAAGGAGTGSNNTNSNYWYDAACVPPQQQGMYPATQQQQQPAATAGGTGQPYPAGGFNYPPQPSGATAYSYPYPYDPTGNFYGTGHAQQQQSAAAVVGAPVTTGLVPAVPAAAGLTGSANSTATPGVAGTAAAAAGAAAAVGAGAAAATAGSTPQVAQQGQQRQQQ